MSYPTIAEVKKLPAKSPVAGVQGRVSDIGQRRRIPSGAFVQEFILTSAGEEISVSAWNHNDLGVYNGQEVIIQESPKGGLKTEFDKYKNGAKLSVSERCTFQIVEVYRGNQAQSSQALHPPGASSYPGAQPTLRGEKVGMLMNNACLFLTTAGEAFNKEKVFLVAKELLEVSNALEAGKDSLSPKEATSQA